MISIIAGLVIFTFLFENGQEASAGEGMLFVSLPIVFGAMSYGWIISVLFFLAVLFAGITSTISILEPPVAYFANTYRISRAKVAYIISTLIFLVGIFVILSFSAQFGKYFTFFDKTLFVWVDFITAAVIMPLGALSALIFLTYFVKKQIVYKFARGFMSRKLFNVWYGIVKFVAPVVIIAVLVWKFIDTFK